jgi:hypothetical protein
MKKLLILLAAAAAMTFYAPASSNAQGIVVGVPGVGGVQIGEPNRPHYRGYDGDRRVYRERREFREREVRGGGGCRTVTIERDDGTVKRIRRCD